MARRVKPLTRKERAQATRARIVQAAYEQFCEQGYLPTTMDSIAAASSVAIQTVYYVFRTKAMLLRAVTETAGAGAPDPLPVMERPWMREAMSSADPRHSLELIVEHGVDIYARVAPLLDAIHTAASVDEDVAAYWASVTDGRRRGMDAFAATLGSRRFLRKDLDAKRAADILFVLDSHETFLGLTKSGWTLAEFKAWLLRTLCQQLLRA
jgi:AcrR family transcriptional regulator